MKFLAAFFALVLSAHAISYIGDVTLTAPYSRTDEVSVLGNLTLVGAGSFAAASWNITGNVTFATAGNSTFTATAGGINALGTVKGPASGTANVSISYVGTLNFTGTIAASVVFTDTTQAAPAVAPVAPLQNISTRAQLAPGGSLNPGFVIGGSLPRRVLVRAVGPGLTPFGVTGVMANPTLAIFSGQTQIATNDDHAGATAAVAAAVGAFALPQTSRDAALVLTLAPGSYTALIRGGAGEGGDVLAEIYFVN
ncbi:MAG: hypothetical protein H7343_10185 [Undibacterium sp.]|nr:hypothetical protein [Opitutaceae bacterium]